MTSNQTSPEEQDENIQQLAKLIQTAKIARNAIHPANVLSNEILDIIFTYYHEHQIIAHKGRGRWAPAHVCRRWRYLVLGVAEYWRQITVTDKTSLECVESILSRSGNTPLVVRINLNSPELRSPEKCTDLPVLNRVLKELPRIHTLLVSSTICVSDYILTSLRGPAPLLSDLSIAAMGVDVRLSADRGVVVLRQCGPMPFKSSLRTLHLALCGVPKHDDLRAALKGLPNLECLSFWVSRVHTTTELFVDEPIALPHLRSLGLSATASVCARFLHSLSIPPACRLSVDWMSDRNAEIEDGAALGRALARKLWGADTDAGAAPLVKLDSDAKHADVLDRKLSLSMWRDRASNDPDAPFVLAVETEAYRLESLFHALPILPKVRCLILGDRYTICAPALRLDTLCNVEEIAIRRDDASSSHLLVHLLRRRVQQEAPSLLFPKLKTIHLPWIIFDDKWIHDPCADDEPLPRLPAPTSGRAKISVPWLKAALEKRKKHGLPAVSLVLTSPVGMDQSAMRTLDGLVTSITVDGKILDLSAEVAAPPTETAAGTDSAAEPAKAEDSAGNDDSTDGSTSSSGSSTDNGGLLAMMEEMTKAPAAEGDDGGEEGGGDDDAEQRVESDNEGGGDVEPGADDDEETNEDEEEEGEEEEEEGP